MTHRPRVAFVVNGGPNSPMAERARSFATRIAARFDCRLIFRMGTKLGAVRSMVRELFAFRPRVCYVLDLAVSGVIAAGAYKLATGTPYVLDTGDAVVELGKALGRSRHGVAATQAMEAYALRAASAVVVRGSIHRELLARRHIKSVFIPDGVNLGQFAHRGAAVSTDGLLVIGVVGSSVWIPARQMCYGWELVEVVRLMRDRVRGVMIGDGSGIEILRKRCEEYGIENLVEFAGRVPYEQLPDRLSKLHVCLSTQTNDVIGNVRTTGKLPLYLAAGRFVLASRVGEASRVLPPEMLVDFAGETDSEYPKKLAERITNLISDGVQFDYREDCVAMARQHFDYQALAIRVERVLDSVLAHK